MKPSLAWGLLVVALASPLRAGTVYVPYVTDELVGSVRYRTQIGVYNGSNSPARVRTLFVSAEGVRHSGPTMTVRAHESALLPRIVPADAHGHLAVTGPAGITFSALLMAVGEDGRLLSSVIEPVVPVEELQPAGQAIYLDFDAPDPVLLTADSVFRLEIVTAEPLGSCSIVAYLGDAKLSTTSTTGAAALSRDIAEPLQALHAAALGRARNPLDQGPSSGPWLEVTCDMPAYAYAAVLRTDGSRTDFVGSASIRYQDTTCYLPTLTIEELMKLPTARAPAIAPDGQGGPTPPPIPEPPSPRP